MNRRETSSTHDHQRQRRLLVSPGSSGAVYRMEFDLVGFQEEPAEECERRPEPGRDRELDPANRRSQGKTVEVTSEAPLVDTTSNATRRRHGRPPGPRTSRLIRATLINFCNCSRECRA